MLNTHQTRGKCLMIPPAALQMPQSKWATQTGQDFTNHTNIKDIDFGGIHVWPDNWEMYALRPIAPSPSIPHPHSLQ